MSGFHEAASVETQEERHWFLAIDDTDVGPMDISEIEARWRAGDINEKSLVWRPGMLDWQTVGELPELGYLQREMPQGNSELPVLPEVRWEASEAMSLTALVARELECLSVETEDGSSAALFATDDELADSLPDLSALGFQHRSLVDGWGLPGGTAPSMPALPAAWQRDSGERSKTRILGALIGAGCLVLILGLVLAIVELLRGPESATQGVAQMQRAEPSLESDTSEAMLVPVALAPPASPPMEQRNDSGPSHKASSGRTSINKASRDELPRTSRAGAGASSKNVSRSKPRSSSHGSSRRARDASDSSTARDSLSRSDIFAGIKKNASNLMLCLRAARTKGEIQPGRFSLILEWIIQPDGSVAKPRLKGPGPVLGTSLPACFASRMRSWRFPSARRSSTVRNFKLPINVN
jgi:hypothetical protein